MNLAEAIASQLKPKRPKCTVHALLGTLDDDDREVMVTALANPTLLAPQIARGMELAGLPKISAQTLRRHRAGECGCER